MSGSISAKRMGSDFREAVRTRKPDRRKRVPTVSIRFSDEERQMLARHADGKPISRYVRDCVLKAHGAKRQGLSRSPDATRKEIARVLGILGRSDLSALLRDIVRAVDTGGLLLDAQTEGDLRQACADIAVMRGALLGALGLRSGAVA